MLCCLSLYCVSYPVAPSKYRCLTTCEQPSLDVWFWQPNAAKSRFHNWAWNCKLLQSSGVRRHNELQGRMITQNLQHQIVHYSVRISIASDKSGTLLSTIVRKYVFWLMLVPSSPLLSIETKWDEVRRVRRLASRHSVYGWDKPWIPIAR